MHHYGHAGLNEKEAKRAASIRKLRDFACPESSLPSATSLHLIKDAG